MTNPIEAKIEEVINKIPDYNCVEMHEESGVTTDGKPLYWAKVYKNDKSEYKSSLKSLALYVAEEMRKEISDIEDDGSYGENGVSQILQKVDEFIKDLK